MRRTDGAMKRNLKRAASYRPSSASTSLLETEHVHEPPCSPQREAFRDQAATVSATFLKSAI